MAHGAVGDQPGQHVWHYLAPWQNLPDGTFIATNKFVAPDQRFYILKWDNDYNHAASLPIYGFAKTNSIPFPTETNSTSTVYLPYIAFNYLGQLTFDGQNPAGRDEYIPLARRQRGARD